MLWVLRQIGKQACRAAGNASPTPGRKVGGAAAASADDGDVAVVMEVGRCRDANWRRRNVDWLVLRSYEHVCCCGINRFSPPGQREVMNTCALRKLQI